MERFAFNSDSYHPIFFLQVLESILVKYKENNINFAILNNKGQGLLYAEHDLDQNVLAFVDHGSYKLNQNSISIIPWFNNINSKIHIFAVKDCSGERLFADCDIYKRIVAEIFFCVLQSIKYFNSHIHMHLSKRSFGEKSIADVDSVKICFAEIMTIITGIEMLKEPNHYKFVVIANKVMQVLYRLINLGGARSILEGSLIQFTNEFELFKKIFFTDESEALL